MRSVADATPSMLELKFRRGRRVGREEVFPVFLLLTPSSRGIRVGRGRKWKRKELRIRFCTPLRNFQGRAAQERPSAGPHPCNAAHEPCHRAGKLFLSIYSPPSFFLTPPTNKGRGCHSPKKTSGGIQNFFGTPSPSGAAAAFLVNLSRSICAAARRPTRRGRRDGQVLHD